MHELAFGNESTFNKLLDLFLIFARHFRRIIDTFWGRLEAAGRKLMVNDLRLWA